jgi:hypothetical protein
VTTARPPWLLPAIALAAGMLAALLVPAFFGHATVPLVVLGTLVVAVGLAWLVVHRLRRNGVRLFEDSPLAGLDRADRRIVTRSIRRGEPPPGALAEVTLRSARQIAARAPLYWLIVGFGLLQVVNLANLAGAQRWISITLYAVVLAAVSYVGLQLRHARRYPDRAGGQR